MKNKILLGFLAVIFLFALTSVFTVDETEQAVVLQFGNPQRAEREAGLNFKLPWPVQNTIKYEKRLLEYDANPTNVITKDKKTLIVDNYARWRIIDPIKFLQTLKNENSAYSRLDDIIYSELRVELGKHNFTEIIAENRESIMNTVTKRSNEKLITYGLEVIDVRIKRVDLPQENEKAVFGRMQAERKRQANKYRSEGEEEATKIMAQTDKEKEIILAEAYRKSEEIKGHGDAKAISIYAEAFNRDPDFYNFMRKLEAYKKTLKDKTYLILSPDNSFLDVLQKGK
jgi:membrane protease subunit HflC